jgi:GDP-D-mannose dehydratase
MNNKLAVVSAIQGDKAPARKVGDVIVRVDPAYFRPAEVETLLGDPSLAKKDLGWIPHITLDEMVQEMVATIWITRRSMRCSSAMAMRCRSARKIDHQVVNT